jgi:hypothetical protein
MLRWMAIYSASVRPAANAPIRSPGLTFKLQEASKLEETHQSSTSKVEPSLMMGEALPSLASGLLFSSMSSYSSTPSVMPLDHGFAGPSHGPHIHFPAGRSTSYG